MIQFIDIVSKFKDLADARTLSTETTWHFIFGSEPHQNYEADKNKYAADDKVLAVFPFTISPQNNPNTPMPNLIRFNGLIALGQKRDLDNKVASIKETYYQKYLARLKSLNQLLFEFVHDFACANGMQIESETYQTIIDRYDADIDFVSCQLTIVQ